MTAYLKLFCAAGELFYFDNHWDRLVERRQPLGLYALNSKYRIIDILSEYAYPRCVGITI